VPIQLAPRVLRGSLGWPFPVLKYRRIIIFRMKYARRQSCRTALGNCCGLKLAKCRDSSFLNINFIVLFIAIFGALSLPVVAVLRLRRWTGQRARHAGGGGTVAVVPVSGRGRAVLAAARPR